MPPSLEELPLIGRAAELDRLRAWVRRGRGAPLVGPAGTRKSRLAREIGRMVGREGRRRATDIGRRSTTIRATEAAAAVRLGAFAPLLADFHDAAVGLAGFVVWLATVTRLSLALRATPS
jgi:hypothetical protein